MGRGHDQELDMDMEYDSPPTSLMEAMARAGIKISLGSSSTSTSTAVYDDTNVDVGPAAHHSWSRAREASASTRVASRDYAICAKRGRDTRPRGGRGTAYGIIDLPI